MKHVNNGACSKCLEKLHAFPGIDPILEQWFKQFQVINPDAHISFAGRGKADQEQAFNTGHSKAQWGESPHNYNLAIDIFRLTVNGASFDTVWYRNALGPAVASTPSLTWGGDFKRFIDQPHVELTGWKDLVRQLVE